MTRNIPSLLACTVWKPPKCWAGRKSSVTSVHLMPCKRNWLTYNWENGEKLPVYLLSDRSSSGQSALLFEAIRPTYRQCPAQTITIDQEHTLVAGLHRLEAAKRLGWTEIECNVCTLDAACRRGWGRWDSTRTARPASPPARSW